MSQTKIVKGFDLSGVIEKKHEGMWVAVSPDYKKVVGFSSDILKLEKKVGTDNVVYVRAPKGDMGYCL